MTAGPRRAAVVWLSALTAAVLLGACDGGGGTPTAVGDASIDSRVAERLLSKADIERVGADAGGLDRRVEDIYAVAIEASPTQVEHIETWHSVTFTREAEGPTLILSVVEYDTPGPAERRLDVSEAGPAFERMDQPIGDRSILGLPDVDTGTAVTFLQGVRLVTLQAPAGNDGRQLLDPAQLLELAQLVADRL